MRSARPIAGRWWKRSFSGAAALLRETQRPHAKGQQGYYSRAAPGIIALTADQEWALRSRGVAVVVLHSKLRAAERRAALDRLNGGGQLVVLTTPETLESQATAPCFERIRPALLCIDEAHCISEWVTTSGRPTCGSVPPASGWAIRRGSHSRRPRRHTSAAISPKGFACAIRLC
jgi:hypothetical protein